MGSKYAYILSIVISFDLAYPPNANPPKQASEHDAGDRTAQSIGTT